MPQGHEPGTSEPDKTSSCDAEHAPNIPALALEPVVSDSGLYTLAFATQAPGSNDWYLVEQRGRILIARDGHVLDQPFLDLQNEISLGAGFDQTTTTYDERGLVGLAFAPDYADSGLCYMRRSLRTRLHPGRLQRTPQQACFFADLFAAPVAIEQRPRLLR